MALDKKSNFHTRIASLAALAVMILTLIICFFVLSSDTPAPMDPSTLIVGAPPAEKEENTNILPLLLSVVFFLLLFLVIVYLAMKEHKKFSKK